MLGIKNKKPRTLVQGVAIVVCVIIDAYRMIYYDLTTIFTIDSPLGISMAILTIIDNSKGFLKYKMWIATIFSFMVTALVNFLIVGFILSLYEIDTAHLNEDGVLSASGLFVGLIAIFILNTIYSKLLKGKLAISDFGKANLIFITVYLFLFGFYVTNLFSWYSLNYDFFEIVVNILILISGFAPIVWIIYMIYQRKVIRIQDEEILFVRNREKNQEIIFDESLKNFKILLQGDEKFRKFKHDINDELEYLNQLVTHNDLVRAKEHIKKMMGEVSLIEGLIGKSTGNIITDSVWNTQLNRFSTKEIETTWLGTMPYSLSINERDLLKLFSNLIKNAFEACADAKEQRYVTVRIYDFERKLIFEIENSHSNVLNKCELPGVFKSTKISPSEHGYGTKTIREIVKDNNGVLNHEYSEDVFLVKIGFPSSIYTV